MWQISFTKNGVIKKCFEPQKCRIYIKIQKLYKLLQDSAIIPQFSFVMDQVEPFNMISSISENESEM